MYTIDFNVIINALPQLIEGIKMTVFISFVSAAIAFIGGVAIVFMRTIDIALFRSIATAYVEVIRNVPLLIQIYFAYKVLPGAGLQLNPVACGIIALSLYTAAYISEVLRSGVNSVNSEQEQAAKGLGLSRWQTFYLIIFPQAIRIVIPPLGSQFINLVKNSSLVSFITVTDLFYVVYKGAVDDFRFFEFFMVGALLYMVITGFIALISNLLEKTAGFHRKEVRV